jgi:hypothetical protein
VYPLRSGEAGPKHWLLTLRCPDCESIREGLFTSDAVELFAEELDDGELVLLCALASLAEERMSEAVEFFIRALHADLIVADDFQR